MEKKKIYEEILNEGLEYNKANYVRQDIFCKEVVEKLSFHFKEILKIIGEDPEREGLKKTPLRLAKMYLYLTQGYSVDPDSIIKNAIFTEKYNEMIVVKDIEIYSMCEHHLMPFFGKAHVAYIPNGKIVGLSKIARVVDVYARRLQVQERLTVQIRDCLVRNLEPLGVGVVIEAVHLCMHMRGVEKQHSVAVTSAFSGEFLKTPTREEFLTIIYNGMSK